MKQFFFLSFLLITFYFGSAQEQYKIEFTTETSIEQFVQKQMKLLHKFKMKKFYKSYKIDDFHPIFKEEKFDLTEQIEKSKEWKNSKDRTFQDIKESSFEEFYNEFTLHIYNKQQLKENYNETALTIISKENILKTMNSSINFTENQYLVFLSPKFETDQFPKYGEFFVLQLIEKQNGKWKVVSSYF